HAAESAARSPSPRGRRTAENSAQAQTHSQALTTSTRLTRRGVVEAASTPGRPVVSTSLEGVSPPKVSNTSEPALPVRRCQTPPAGATSRKLPELLRIRWRSDLEEKPLRVLDALLDPDEELHRLAAVDEAVVVAQGQVHHRPDDDLPVPDHGALDDVVHPQ